MFVHCSFSDFLHCLSPRSLKRSRVYVSQGVSSRVERCHCVGGSMKVQKCSKDSSGKMSTGVLNDVEEY